MLVVITDMQGRLQGKRLHARYFMDEVLAHGTEGCNYLLAVDVDMNTVDGYAMTSWATGYGDFVMTPDLSTLRHVPWQPGHRHAHRRPRLARRLRRRGLAAPDPQAADRAAGRTPACRPSPGTELEFIVFNDTYEAGLDVRLPRPDAGQPLQRRLLDARHGSRRAAAPADPQLAWPAPA